MNLRHLYALCAERDLTRDERHELAEMLLKRDVVSYASLTASEIDRLVDALNGYHYVLTLLELRPYESRISV